MKTKKNQNVTPSGDRTPLVRIELRPLISSDSKSNTILSGLTWQLLIRLRLLEKPVRRDQFVMESPTA